MLPHDDKTGQWSKMPMHDENSHAADSFRYLAMSLRDVKKPKIELKLPQGLDGPVAGGWML